MNIRTNEAGSVTHEYILKSGFKVFDEIKGNDMGQMTYEMPQYTNGKIKILGGYWNYSIVDMENNILWSGWWNSNGEFDEVIKSLKQKI